MSATFSRHSAKTPAPPAVDYRQMARDVNKSFSYLVKQLGWPNTKGTERYEYEVEFAYAMNEFVSGPEYMQFKRIETMSAIVSELSDHVNETKKVKNGK